MAFLLLFIGIVFIDQAVKFWIVTNLTFGQTVQFIPGILSITREQNSGVAFSLFSDVSGIILAMISVVIVLVIIILMATKVINGRAQRWALTFVVAGAISNALDRFISGYVVDMFRFEFITFGIFNVADICIVCGIIVFAILFIASDSGKKDTVDSKKIKRERKSRAEQEPDKRRDYDLSVDDYRDKESDNDRGYDTEGKKYSLDEILEEFYRDSDDK